MPETFDEDLGSGQLGLDTPNIARMYDYFLGGSAHTAADRAASDAIIREVPHVSEVLRFNRAFLARAVRVLVRRGIDQFLDLGSGIPTVGNVHEIAQAHDPCARVAYVDWELVAVTYARRMLGENPRVTVTQADIRDPGTVLAAPEVAGLLDWDRPVAVLLLATLDILAPADAGSLVAAYRDASAPGSALALTNGAQLGHSDADVARYRDLLERTSTPHLRLRTHDEVVELFDSYTLLEPGVVPTPSWRPDHPVTTDDVAAANAYAGVGVLPAPE